VAGWRSGPRALRGVRVLSRGTKTRSGANTCCDARGVAVRTLRPPAARSGRRAFTLLDVLVSMAVIAILIGLLMPSMSSIHETARRVVCQSNIRQIGMGLLMYADDWKGQLPPSVFLRYDQGVQRTNQSPQNMLTIRLEAARAEYGTAWDGIGLLASMDYLNGPKVFYCPSHRGDNPYSKYAPTWNNPDGEIVCNYHFRGEGPRSSTRVGGRLPMTRSLYNIDPAQSSLLADGMRVRSDCNHRVGVNFFRADLTVHWFNDPGARLLSSLPTSKEMAVSRLYVDDAWSDFDRSANDEAR
jgi:type II secretory pathway pseudopilin PulG